jgi:hypothetical protein
MSEKEDFLSAVFSALANVRRVHFSVENKESASIGWQGEGKGDVLLLEKQKNKLVFQERGTWKSGKGAAMKFSNTFCFTRVLNQRQILISHLRYGLDRPTDLVTLKEKEGVLVSVKPHECGQDSYEATMGFIDTDLYMNWMVQGSHKKAWICYRYSLEKKLLKKELT